MAYILLTWLLISLVAGTILYLTRRHWTHRLPTSVQDFLYRLPSSSTAAYSRLNNTFMDDAEAGMHSADFNLAENIEGEDTRGGLDPEQRREVQRLMKVRGIGFDEARRELMEKRFKGAGIGKDGLPKDPKLVTFS